MPNSWSYNLLEETRTALHECFVGTDELITAGWAFD